MVDSLPKASRSAGAYEDTFSSPEELDDAEDDGNLGWGPLFALAALIDDRALWRARRSFAFCCKAPIRTKTEHSIKSHAFLTSNWKTPCGVSSCLEGIPPINPAYPVGERVYDSRHRSAVCK